MLDFSARKGVKPLVQVYKHNGVDSIEAAFKSMEENKVRYRAVLEF
jgi:D-arabinose 1-dehydrogenase-like Zn-dependent alcohol dehydrogenase